MDKTKDISALRENKKSITFMATCWQTVKDGAIPHSLSEEVRKLNGHGVPCQQPGSICITKEVT